MTVAEAPTFRTSSQAGSQAAPRARPLLIRAGAHFDCFGDGLCCTDIHALGPLTRPEKQAVELLAPGSLVRNKNLAAPVFRTDGAGACVNRSARGCELHAVHGAEAKPVGCARFPFGLVTTPEGGRVTTEHRCPCRTLGERPALSVEAAEPWLKDAAGRLSSNGKVGPKVRIGGSRRVSFGQYRLLEQEMLDGLLSGQDPLRVLGQRPFVRLEGLRWTDIAKRADEERDGTAYGEAMVWFGAAVRAARGKQPIRADKRPWAAAFDRAEARAKRKARAEDVLADWLADLLWALDWTFVTHSFVEGTKELATLYAVAQEITGALVRRGVRADRAAAEAVMVAELARQSQFWDDVQKAL